MKLHSVLLIVFVAFLSACAQVPITSHPAEGVVYGSGQDVRVDARGSLAMCDKLMGEAAHRTLSRDEMNAVRECYNQQRAVHKAGLEQQRNDQRFVMERDRFDAREEEAAFRRTERTVNTVVRVIERLDRLGK